MKILMRLPCRPTSQKNRSRLHIDLKKYFVSDYLKYGSLIVKRHDLGTREHFQIAEFPEQV